MRPRIFNINRWKHSDLLWRYALLLACVSLILAIEVKADNSESAAGRDPLMQGAYLTRVGNCMGCHTAKGGRPFAGGLRLSTPFGTFVTTNITPDEKTGIGLWSEEEFWQALHEGRSRDGRFLYPAFPYTEYTKITRQDANAIFAYLKSLSPVSQSNLSHDIYFPYYFKPLLAMWRSLYFKIGVFEANQSQNDAWNRGAYLVQGLGHCNACHTTHNLFGASQGDALAGGQIMGMNWYAPSLSSKSEAGSADWEIKEMVEFLKIGITKRAVASGPMAGVIKQSLQYLSQEDAYAMAVYLKSLPGNKSGHIHGVEFSVMTGSWRRQMDLGKQLYEKYCQTCHGTNGEGAPGTYPALAGNRSVMLSSSLNVIRTVLNGGYPPTTIGNPRPYGMPPFQQILRNEEVALVVSYIRNAWGNRSSLVTAVDVDRSKGGNY